MNAVTDPFFKIEGLVAEDLEFLAKCAGVDRKDMLAVLQRGHNIIHTDKEFREQFRQQFPNIDLAKCPPIDSPVTSNPSSTTSAKTSPVSERQPVDTAELVKALRADTDAQGQVTNQLRKDLEDSFKAAAEPGVCTDVSCELVAERVVRPERLRGAIELSELLQRQLEAELATLQFGERSTAQFSKDFEAVHLATKTIFESERKEIVKRALDHSINALAPFVARDKTGALAGQSAQLARQLRLLEMRTPTNDAYLTFLKLPRSARDDGLEFAAAVPSQWNVKQIVLIAVLILFGILLVSILAWLARLRLA